MDHRNHPILARESQGIAPRLQILRDQSVVDRVGRGRGTRHQVQTLLRELKRDERIEVQGATKAARWFPSGSKRNPTQ